MNESVLLDLLSTIRGPLQLDGIVEALADPYDFLTSLGVCAAELFIRTRLDADGPGIRWQFSPRSLAHMLERAGWTCCWPGRNPVLPRSFWRRAAGKVSRLMGRRLRSGSSLELTATLQTEKPKEIPLPTLGLVMIAAPADADLLISNLEQLPPCFDQTVVVVDAEPGQPPLAIKEALVGRLSALVVQHNVNVVCRKSNYLFGDQRNYGNILSQTEWVFQLDCDESLTPAHLRALPALAARMERLGITVCGFPRRDARVSLDEDEHLPDYQYRLMRRQERWVSATHDYPKTVIERPDKIWWCDQVVIEHRPQPRSNWWWRERDTAGNLRSKPPKGTAD